MIADLTKFTLAELRDMTDANVAAYIADQKPWPAAMAFMRAASAEAMRRIDADLAALRDMAAHG